MAEVAVRDATVANEEQVVGVPERVSLRTLVVGAGLLTACLFVLVGVGYGLQMYGDGSIFSYAVAVEDTWAFHWHNIAPRAFVYLFCSLPAEAYVGLTGDAKGGILVYGLLFFSAQLVGLAATYLVDRSGKRTIFTYGCFSTAAVCPLVFGFPTEMWMAHALFWPALALCHYAPLSGAGTAAVFAVMLALVLTHEGALVLSAAILFTLALSDRRGAPLRRALGAFAAVLLVWVVVRLAFPPEAYFASVLVTAALNFIDVTDLVTGPVLLLLAALAAYALLYLALRRPAPRWAGAIAGLMVAAGLAVYWLRFDHALSAENRYYLRTALLLATPALGTLAVLHALTLAGRLALPLPWLGRAMGMLTGARAARAAPGALLLILLVHGVETAKFVSAWTDYKAAVRALAMSSASDPWLGDDHFVSSARIDPELNRLAWSSTTQFLSVLVVPGFRPARLVLDPDEGYFWLSCPTATANEVAHRALPQETRRLERLHACLGRNDRTWENRIVKMPGPRKPGHWESPGGNRG